MAAALLPITARPHRQLEPGPGVRRRVVAIEGDGLEPECAQVGGTIVSADKNRYVGEREQRRNGPVAGIPNHVWRIRGGDRPIRLYQVVEESLAVYALAGQLLGHAKDTLLRLNRVGPVAKPARPTISDRDFTAILGHPAGPYSVSCGSWCQKNLGFICRNHGLQDE
jgi:hypothetical protein